MYKIYESSEFYKNNKLYENHLANLQKHTILQTFLDVGNVKYLAL